MAETVSTIEIRESAGVHLITMSRPARRNALNPQMIEDLSAALEASERCACGAVVLTGAGSAFCSGMDLQHLQSVQNRPEDQRADAEAYMWLMRRLYSLTKPTIAAVNGAALAGGTGLALQCDFTLAVAGAKFGYTEVKIGFIPAVVAVFLIEMAGEKRARELLLSGSILSGEEAFSLGLVTEIVPDGELMARALSLAASLMRNSLDSMRELKKLLCSFSQERLDRELRHAVRWSEKVRNGPDFAEGVRAFLEKRDPVWPSRKRP